MSDKIKLIIFFGVIVLGLGGGIAYNSFKDYLHSNPEGTVGNTTGNLNNGGMFCEKDGKLFFANAYDNNRLYVMNLDGTGAKCLTDSPVSYINVDKNYVYYFINNLSSVTGMGGFKVSMLGLYRTDKKGNKTKCMEKVTCGVVQLIDNDLFYQRYDNKDGISLQRMDTRNKETEKVMGFDANPACVYDGKIYYNGKEGDHYLYVYDPKSKTSQMIYDGNIWNPDYQNGYIYFMNIDDDYCLYRYNIASGEAEKITDDRCDTFICCGDYIFYQKNSKTEPALMQIRADGSEPMELAEGNYTNFGVAGGVFYFSEFGLSTPMYQYNVLGGGGVQTFTAAEEAALKKK